MTTTEQIAGLLPTGEQHGWLNREEIDELASGLVPDARALLFKRVALRGLKMRKPGEATAAKRTSASSRAACDTPTSSAPHREGR